MKTRRDDLPDGRAFFRLSMMLEASLDRYLVVERDARGEAALMPLSAAVSSRDGEPPAHQPWVAIPLRGAIRS